MKPIIKHGNITLIVSTNASILLSGNVLELPLTKEVVTTELEKMADLYAKRPDANVNTIASINRRIAAAAKTMPSATTDVTYVYTAQTNAEEFRWTFIQCTPKGVAIAPYTRGSCVVAVGEVDGVKTNYVITNEGGSNDFIVEILKSHIAANGIELKDMEIARLPTSLERATLDGSTYLFVGTELIELE